ncbi:MAG: hypothetical protein JO217_04540 [Acidobacteriaceae bacterium]|nr:hypothetical protein [Acidobacteriaceae bacterium]MBV9441941.1 hypothetical protein [Acidobacteriaceae bacterium]
MKESLPLPLCEIYYPYGFPVVIKSNHPGVLEAARQSWNSAQQQFQEPPLELRVSVSEYKTGYCPSAPVWQLQKNLLIMIANSKNFSTCDLGRGFGSAWLTTTAAANLEYLRHYFVESMAYALLESCHVVTIRAACLAKYQSGVLLFEPLGPRKGVLAQCLADRGWTMFSECATCFPLRHGARMAIGNRPPSPTYPEKENVADEYPSRLAHTTLVDYIVYVNKDKVRGDSAHLTPISREEVRQRLLEEVPSEQWPFQSERLAAVERLLEAHLYQMSYSDADGAVDLLEGLLRHPTAPAERG